MPTQNRRRRGGNSRNGNADHRLLKSLSHAVNGQGVMRVRANKQITSVPNHNFQMKMRKVFRVYSKPGLATITIAQIKAAVNLEIAATDSATIGQVFSIHGGRVYCASSTASFSGITVGIYDIEESATTSANLVALFEDNSSSAGIAHVSWVYANNNRPTFSVGATPTIAVLSANPVAATDLVVVDLDITYIRTPTATTFLNGVLALDINDETEQPDEPTNVDQW